MISSPIARPSSPTTRTPRSPIATARASPGWPRRSAARPRAARASPRRPHAAITSCSPTRTSTRWRGCSPMPAFEKALGDQFEAPRQARVPSGAAAAGASRQAHRRAAQDEVRALDAAGVPPAREGQAPARHGLGRVRLYRTSASSSAR